MEHINRHVGIEFGSIKLLFYYWCPVLVGLGVEHSWLKRRVQYQEEADDGNQRMAYDVASMIPAE